MNETWENGTKKLQNLGLILTCLAQIWASKIFLAGFTSTSSQTLFQAIILCNLKEN